MWIISQAGKLIIGSINLGTAEFDEKTARKIRVINIVTLITAFFLAVVTITMYLQDHWTWKRSAGETAILFTLLLPVFFMHRIGYQAKVAFFMVWFFIFFGTLISHGARSGIHFYLLIIPVIMFYFLGSNRKFLVAAITVLSTTLYLLIVFTFPDAIPVGETFYDTLKIPFVDEFRLEGNDNIRIMNITVVELILYLTTYYSFSTIEKAEVALEREYTRSELLLQNLLPKSIAARLKDHPDDVIADQFDDVSILFADIEGFTKRSSEQSAEKVVGHLNLIFSEFDRLADKHGLEKIKTIGDAYMVAGGMPEKRAGHASALAEMALDMIEAVENLSEKIDENISIRIGLHSGPAVAGVIGRQKPFYDVWGDTINIASRMESSGSAGRIQITPELKDILGAKFEFEERGVVNIKGKGKMKPFYLVGRTK